MQMQTGWKWFSGERSKGRRISLVSRRGWAGARNAPVDGKLWQATRINLLTVAHSASAGAFWGSLEATEAPPWGRGCCRISVHALIHAPVSRFSVP